MSGITALAVVVTLGNMNTVLAVFGAWAILAGLLPLATGVRRWKCYDAQWAMILSGTKSALAGGLFIIASEVDALAGSIARHALNRPTEPRTLGAATLAINAARATVRRAIVYGGMPLVS